VRGRVEAGRSPSSHGCLQAPEIGGRAGLVVGGRAGIALECCIPTRPAMVRLGRRVGALAALGGELAKRNILRDRLLIPSLVLEHLTGQREMQIKLDENGPLATSRQAWASDYLFESTDQKPLNSQTSIRGGPVSGVIRRRLQPKATALLAALPLRNVNASSLRWQPGSSLAGGHRPHPPYGRATADESSAAPPHASIQAHSRRRPTRSP
jgi:hypothetical protein